MPLFCNLKIALIRWDPDIHFYPRYLKYFGKYGPLVIILSHLHSEITAEE